MATVRLRERLLNAFAAAVLIVVVAAPLLWLVGWHGYVIDAIISVAWSRTTYAPGLTRDGLLALHRGQAFDEVRGLLGKPLRRTSREPGRAVLKYAEPNKGREGVEIYLWFEDQTLVRASVQHFDCELMRLGEGGAMVLTERPSWAFSWILPRR